MKDNVIKLFGNSKGIFLNYKFTFGLIFINTLLLIFSINNTDNNEFVTALLFSNVLFFFVESFTIKDKNKILFLLSSVILSGVLNHILYVTENGPRIPILIFGIYIGIFLLTMYLIAKKEDNFYNYILRVFNNNIVLFISSIIIELGLLFITIVIDNLLLTNSDFNLYLKMEILFIGLFVVPGEIIALTNKNNDFLKLVKPLILYVLVPIVILLFIIIYIYLIKIIITFNIPKNSIFMIITALFIISFPTWLLLNNYKGISNIYDITIKYLPYLFILLIGMQIYSLFIRVYEYGFTISRYFGFTFILFEVGSIILSKIKNSKYLNRIFLFGMMLVLCSFSLPFINCISISSYSQVKIITSIYMEDTNIDMLDTDSKNKLDSAYNYLVNNLNGEKYLPTYIDKTKIEFDHYSYLDDRGYINFDNKVKEIDISEYNKISKITIYESLYSSHKKLDELSFKELNIYDNSILKENLLLYLNIVLDKGNVSDYVVKLDDNYTLFIDSLYITYDKETRELSRLEIDGYILIK